MPQPAQQPPDALPRRRRERCQRDVGAMQAGTDNRLDAMVPCVVFVAVLSLRAQVGNLLLDAIRIFEALAAIAGSGASARAPDSATRRRPTASAAGSCRHHSGPISTQRCPGRMRQSMPRSTGLPASARRTLCSSTLMNRARRRGRLAGKTAASPGVFYTNMHFSIAGAAASCAVQGGGGAKKTLPTFGAHRGGCEMSAIAGSVAVGPIRPHLQTKPPVALSMQPICQPVIGPHRRQSIALKIQSFFSNINPLGCSRGIPRVR